MFQSITVVFWLTLSLCQANVIFHFSLDFNVKPENATEIFNKTITVQQNRVFIQDESDSIATTTVPWTDQPQYNDAAQELLRQTQRAVQQFNTELSPLVGRSNDLAARLKQTLRYVNEVDTSLEEGLFPKYLELLRKYVTLVDNLRSPARAGGARTLEFVLLKLSMEKYQLLERQQEVSQYLERADAAWNTFKNNHVVISES